VPQTTIGFKVVQAVETCPMNTEITPTSTIHVCPARREDFRPIAALIALPDLTGLRESPQTGR
jgi:hypothetical protein